MNTKIEWATDTFSPWWGCTKVSEACRFCYAEAVARRFKLDVWGNTARRRFQSDKYWRQPLYWNDIAARTGIRRRVFCASMCDVFEDRRDLDPWRKRLWTLVEKTPHLDWLLLTKRSENLLRFVPDGWRNGWPTNAWPGVTAEDQRNADTRIPDLLRVPAAVLWVSAEPLLGPIDFTKIGDGYIRRNSLTGFLEANGALLTRDRSKGLNWIIVGGESGRDARPMRLDWVRSIRDQCAAAGVSFFFKQKKHGSRVVSLPALDGRIWTQIPHAI